MVEANPEMKQQLTAMFAQVAFQKVPDNTQWGNPAAPLDVVEACKATKGKMLSDNAKQMPAEVKAFPKRIQANDPDNGFEGAKFEDKKTGKAKQNYSDGSFFDGFMLEDNLFKGRFYFANGDFYQGSFVDNQMKLGQYQQAGGAQAKCEQTTFNNGVPDGPIEKAQKFTLVHNEATVSLIGTFANGKPTGEVQVTIDGTTITVDSPFDASAQPEPVAAAEPIAVAPVEEEKKEEAPVEAVVEAAAPVKQEAPVVAEPVAAKPGKKNNKKGKGAAAAQATVVEKTTTEAAPVQNTPQSKEKTTAVNVADDQNKNNVDTAQLERDFNNSKAEMERDIGVLKSEVASKEREITLLRQQNEENLKNQEARLKLDQENANQEVASKKTNAERQVQNKELQKLKESLAENRLISEDLKKQADTEKAGKLKAEEEKRAVDVTKTEFVQNALRYAIMRGRQAKVIEKTREEQKQLEQSITESTSEIESLKTAQADSQAEVERLSKLESNLQAKVAAEQAQRKVMVNQQKKTSAQAEQQQTELRELSQQHDATKRQLETSMQERTEMISTGTEELKSSQVRVQELTQEIESSRTSGGDLQNQIQAKEIEHKKVLAELKNVQNQTATLKKEKDKLQKESKQEQNRLKGELATQEQSLRSELMQAQNRSSSNEQNELKLTNDVQDLQKQLTFAESKKMEFELQVEAMLEYNKQIKNIEVQEASLKKLKSTLDQKQKSLETEEKNQRQSEDSLRKEQAEWKSANTKRQQVLETDLQSKITQYADQESEYVQKWESLEESKSAFKESQGTQQAQLDQLKDETSQEYTNVQKSKSEVLAKEKRLAEERKTMRAEKDSTAFKHETDLSKLRAAELTKLLVGSAVCFLLGVAVTMTMFN